MPIVTPQSAAQVEQAFNDYGAAPGGKAMMRAEMCAAEEAIASTVYITWRSEKTGADCSRVSSASRCFCGHALSEHAPVNRSNPRPPACTLCDCKRFDFVPSRPEECGMWWLPRRKGFDVRTWRAPCRCQHGHDSHDPRTHSCRSCSCRVFDSAYQCIGCDGKQAEHSTVFELEGERVQAGRDVGRKFMPLADTPELQRALFASMQRGGPAGGRQREAGAASGLDAARQALGGLSLEEQLEAGQISAAEYHQRILNAPLPEGVDGRLPLVGTGGRSAAGGRHAARPPPTVTALAVPTAGGVATVLTNAGPPIPRPGHDWSRPWEPGASGSSSRSGARKAPAGRT